MPPQVARGDRVAELDVLRGWAAVLMVFNHVGFAVLSPEAATQGISGALVFLGSFAPVLFFFATGFGAGLGPPARWSAVLDKAMLLLLADFLLTWRLEHTTPRLDFFGFIAISMLAVRVVQSAPRPWFVACTAAAALLLLRYVWGAALDAPLEGYGLVRWLLGVTPHDAVSYPGAPWLVYPLVGLALGVGWRARGGQPRTLDWWMLAAAAAVFAAVAGVMALRGASFHRWGGVAAAYFACSVVVVAGFAALSALLVGRLPRAAAVWSLGGVAAFAVVPLHYAMVHGLARVPDVSALVYPGLALAATALSFRLSRWFETMASAAAPSDRPRRWSWIAIGSLAVAVAVMVGLARAGQSLLALWVAALAQLAVGLLFAWRVGPLAALKLRGATSVNSASPKRGERSSPR
jgi:hypothetical protein